MNEKVYTIKISRHELCQLLLATTAASELSDGAQMWSDLHDKLLGQLEKLDEKSGYGVFKQ